MNNENQKIQELIDHETLKIQNTLPMIDNLDIRYEKNHRGTFYAKLKVRTRNKSFIITESSKKPETSIRKVFNKLRRLASRKKHRRPQKLSYEFSEAA